MRRKIEHLTPDQKAAMQPWAEEWIKIGLSTEPADRERAEAAYRACYRYAKLNDDVPIVWVESPIVGALAAPIAANILHSSAVDDAVYSTVGVAVGSAVNSAVGRDAGSAVRRAVGSAVNSTVGSDVYSAVRNAVDSTVGNAVDSDVDSAVDSAVNSAVGSAVGSAVSSTVGSDVYSAVGSDVYSAVSNAVSSTVGSDVYSAVGRAVRRDVDSADHLWWHYWMGGSLWAYCHAFERYFAEVCGLRLPGDLSERGKTYAETAKAAGYWWPNKHFIIACDRPDLILRDDTGRLHSEDGPAIRWRDGWGLYMWHGVRVPAEWIEHRDTVDPAEIIRCENVDQRAAGASIVGWSRMLKHLDRRIIDGDPNTDIGALIELTLPGLPEPGRFLQAVCPRNGTIVEGVPRTSDVDGSPIDTAIAAQAWRDGLPVSEYQHPAIRT